MMRVLHISGGYIRSPLYRLMLEHLDLHGVSSCVFAPTFSKNEVIVDVGTNVIVKECFKYWHRYIFPYKQREILNGVKDSYDINKFNCIHAHTLFTDGFCARALAREYKIPYVVAVRNVDVNVFFAKAFFLRSTGISILKEAAAVFFLSPAYKQTVLEMYVNSKDREQIEGKSYIIPNGIDDYWIRNININKNVEESIKRIQDKKIRILFVGTLDKNKNISLTISAIRILECKGWDISFTVVGFVREKNIYHMVMRAQNTIYYSPQPKEELLEIYRNHDIYVMPSHTETFGLTYAEALSQGLPVIYTRGQGFDRQFREGEVGFSTSDKDAEELAQKIVDIADRYKEISENCIIQSTMFDWTLLTKKYMDLYKLITTQWG